MSKKKKIGLTIIMPLSIGVVVGLSIVGFMVISAAVKGPGAVNPAAGVAASSEAVHDHGAMEHDHGAMMMQVKPDCDFQDFVGQPVDQAALDDLKRPVRILPPNAAATMDYNPERVNVHTDEAGVVTKVDCN